MHDNAFEAIRPRGTNLMRSPETHIAICGHAKHGKSTVAGRLMYEFGQVDDTTLRQLGQEAESRGKDFNAFSLLFLRRRGQAQPGELDPSRTMQPDRGTVILPDNHVLSLIDTPGAQVRRTNTIYGIYLSDYAVLLVDVQKGVEDGTIDVMNIVKALQVQLIATFVTKMDLAGYNQERFNQVAEEIRTLVSAEVPIIPVSAVSGAGFGRQENAMPWYTGVPATDIISRQRRPDAALRQMHSRFVVEGPGEVYSPQGIGTVMVGLLETGSLQPDDELICEPYSSETQKPLNVRVRSLQRARDVAGKADDLEEAVARVLVAVATHGISITDAKRALRHGGTLGPIETPPKVAIAIEASLVFFDKTKVYPGKQFLFHANGAQRQSRITSIKGSEPAQEGESYPIPTNEAVVGTIVLEHLICIEDDPAYHRLTLFVLLEHNQVVACGRCTRIISTEREVSAEPR